MRIFESQQAPPGGARVPSPLQLCSGAAAAQLQQHPPRPQRCWADRLEAAHHALPCSAGGFLVGPATLLTFGFCGESSVTRAWVGFTMGLGCGFHILYGIYAGEPGQGGSGGGGGSGSGSDSDIVWLNAQ